MAAKKGEIPAHVKKKEFSHPNTQHPVICILEKIEDPRKPSQFFRYSLTSVLFGYFHNFVKRLFLSHLCYEPLGMF
jgi:hypothetical protein